MLPGTSYSYSNPGFNTLGALVEIASGQSGTFSHTGSDATAAWVDPNEHLIVLVFCQTPSGPNPRNKFLELVRSSIGR